LVYYTFAKGRFPALTADPGAIRRRATAVIEETIMTRHFIHAQEITSSEPDAALRGVAIDRIGRGVATARVIGFGTLAATVATLAHVGMLGF
jgi:hypothetical protein